MKLCSIIGNRRKREKDGKRRSNECDWSQTINVKLVIMTVVGSTEKGTNKTIRRKVTDKKRRKTHTLIKQNEGMRER